MSWEWSHTNEAYENARANLGELDSETLSVIDSEWRYQDDGEPDGFDWESAKSKAIVWGDITADFIWEKAEELRTCDNGGFNAWVCPYGCHTVSFSRNEERVGT